MAIFKNDFSVGLAKPIEIVLIDEVNNCETRMLSDRVSIKDGEYIAANVRDLPSIFGKLKEKKAGKRPESEKEAMLQAIGGEPFLSMLALADWLEENGQRLEDRFTAEGLRLMVEQGKEPLKRHHADSGVYHWSWIPQMPNTTTESNSARLPKQVYRTLVMKNEGKEWCHGRQSAIMAAALAYGLVANGKGVPEFTEKEVKCSPFQEQMDSGDYTSPLNDPDVDEYETDNDHAIGDQW